MEDFSVVFDYAGSAGIFRIGGLCFLCLKLKTFTIDFDRAPGVNFDQCSKEILEVILG
jgi:hypothetical protein